MVSLLPLGSNRSVFFRRSIDRLFPTINGSYFLASSPLPTMPTTLIDYYFLVSSYVFPNVVHSATDIHHIKPISSDRAPLTPTFANCCFFTCRYSLSSPSSMHVCGVPLPPSRLLGSNLFFSTCCTAAYSFSPESTCRHQLPHGQLVRCNTQKSAFSSNV